MISIITVPLMIIITTALRETPIETTAIIGNILKNRLNKIRS